VTQSQPVEVLLFHVCDDAEKILQAYHRASQQLAGVPGLIENELLQQVFAPDSFLVRSRWQSWEAFDAWERGAAHKDQTEALRPYRDFRFGRPFAIFRRTAGYQAASPDAQPATELAG
jgi:heme-degrading monooxygenase HmoA